MEESHSIDFTESLKRIPERYFFRIGDVAEILDVKPYVLRYWESEFKELAPQKSNTGQRVYKRGDVETLMLIKHLLYSERYSIEGARNRIKDLRQKRSVKQFTEEKVLKTKPVGESAKELLKEARKIASDIQKTVHVPVRELFRY